jgi:hypothetical protein
MFFSCDNIRVWLDIDAAQEPIIRLLFSPGFLSMQAQIKTTYSGSLLKVLLYLWQSTNPHRDATRKPPTVAAVIITSALFILRVLRLAVHMEASVGSKDS